MTLRVGRSISWRDVAALVDSRPGWTIPLAALLGLFAFLATLYLMGTFGIGYESKHVKFYGVARSESGFSFGPKSCYLRGGQEFVIRYQAEAHRGGLRVLVYRYYGSIGESPIERFHITSTGEGTFRARAPESGRYYFRIFGTPASDGYDVSYSLHWWKE